jgi:hypothetical protein
MSNILELPSSAFDRTFSNVLSEIKSRISAVSLETAAFSPQLAYLKHLSAIGLDTLTYEPDCKNETSTFEFSFQQKRIVISDEFRNGWMKMTLGTRLKEAKQQDKGGVLRDSLENFILHELFHRDQQLTSEQHGDYRSAPNIGRIIDYHADASAVLASVLLHSESNSAFEYAHWSALYLRFVRSLLAHICAFVQMGRAEESGDRSISRGDDLDWKLNVFNRHLVWHFQYHKLRAFRLSAHVDQVQLLFEPGLSLRYMHDIDWNGGRPPINRTWPEQERKAMISARMRRSGATTTQSWHEAASKTDYCLSDRANLDRNHLILAAPNFWGIPKIYRFSPAAASAGAYEQLFEGIVESDTEKTKPFFAAAFDDPDWRQLTGHSWLPPGGSPPPVGGDAPAKGQDNVLLDENAPKLYQLAARCAKDFGDRRFIPARANTLRIYPDPPTEMRGEV